ncbi:GntR family transcriptional regulator [Arthrobacter sp. NPDC058192]|uniref:GntR family transcriptional regulator n=1 Tax=Arthrobacter sp. NPDC058192 TaxID=3346372 RepID=UPI0036EB3283
MLQCPIILPDTLFADVDRAGPVPLYFQVSSRIESAILSGELPAGARLENELVLGQKLRLSRPTIRHAIQRLVDQGLLVKRQGIGTQVVHRPVTPETRAANPFEDTSRMGQHPSFRVLTHESIAAPATVAETLGLEAGGAVFHLRRLRLAGGRPRAILENILPEAFATLAPEQFEHNTLNRLLGARGAALQSSKETIGARIASEEEAGLLEIGAGEPVLTVGVTVHDQSGKAVGLGQHCYRSDSYSTGVTLV